MNELIDHYRYGTDASKIVELENEALERVTSENIQNAAKKYLRNTRIEATLMPEVQSKGGAKGKNDAAKTKAEPKAAKAKNKDG